MTRGIDVTLVVQRYGYVEPPAAIVRPGHQRLALLTSDFFGNARRVGNHLLKLGHFLAQLGFLSRQVILGLIEGSGRLTDAPKHGGSRLGTEPDENRQGDNSKNNQRQGDRETDLHPLSKRSATADQVRHIGCCVW